MQKNAVTLIEILIVIIIIAILTAIGAPVYTYKIERTRGERAIANIELIVSAIKMYFIKYNADPFENPPDQASDLSEINNRLGLDLTDNYFTYTTVYSEGDGGVRADRNDSSGRFIKYDIDPLDGDPDDWGPSNWPWMP